MKGIDLSSHNGTVDFSNMKLAGVEFVIIRAGYGDAMTYPSQNDAQFDRNYSESNKYGIHVGAYWYSYAQNRQQAVREAQSFLLRLRGKKFDMPVYIDIEEETVLSLGKSVCDSIIGGFCTTMEQAGYFVGFYCSTYWTKQCISSHIQNRYTQWIADWCSKPLGVPYAIWQNTNAFKYQNKYVDGDICDIDFPSIIKMRGKNGYTAKTGSIVAAMGDTFTHGGKIYQVQPGTVVQVSYEGVKNYEVY